MSLQRLPYNKIIFYQRLSSTKQLLQQSWTNQHTFKNLAPMRTVVRGSMRSRIIIKLTGPDRQTDRTTYCLFSEADALTKSMQQVITITFPYVFFYKLQWGISLFLLGLDPLHTCTPPHSHQSLSGNHDISSHP